MLNSTPQIMEQEKCSGIFVDTECRDVRTLATYLQDTLGIALPTSPEAYADREVRLYTLKPETAAYLSHPDYIHYLLSIINSRAKYGDNFLPIRSIQVQFLSPDDPRSFTVINTPQGSLRFSSDGELEELSFQDYYDPNKTLHIFDDCVIITTNN